MTAIWDEAFLKQRERDAREDALAVQSDADWESAILRFERAMSNCAGGFVDCPLPACRRAHRCVGNKPVCMPRCALELEPGAEQELVDQFYAEIQQERRNAAAEGRAPRVTRALTHRVHEEEVVAPVSPKPVSDEFERNMRVVREALKDVPPAPKPPPLKPPPQQQPKLEPPPSAPPLRPPEPAPAAWVPQVSPEVEERVNQIWADYVAGKPMPRPEPRIRSLSDDDRAWGVPPWWKGVR
jgi:hypothetical protein